MDVAIVGVGLHPFGRFAGVTGHRHGRDRDPARARRRGRRVARHPVRVRRQLRDRQPGRRGRAPRAHGDPVHRTSTTGARPRRARSTLAANTIRLGEHDLGIAVGMDKHLPGAFSADPRLYACPSWYGELGQFVTTKFFGMKINKYMHDHGISRDDARQGRGEELPQRRAESERVPAQAALGGGDPRVADVEPPAHAVHVLQPRRRRRRGRAVPGRTRAPLHRHADLPARLDRAHAPARCVRGAQPVASDRRDGRPDRRCVARRVRDGRHRPRGRRRDPAPGHRRRCRGDPSRRERILRRRRPGGTRGRRGAGDRRSRCPVNTDGGLIANGEPIGASGLRQVHEVVLQLRGQAGDRQVPGNPRVGYTQLYGAPGTAGVSILST